MPLEDNDKKIISDNIGFFIWTYKKGDNIVYNFEILFALYGAKNTFSENKSLFNKPIIIIIISIIECILDDFVNRIQQRLSDPLPNITPDVVNDFKYKIKGNAIKFKKLECFNHYIDNVGKHNIFGNNKNIYKILHILRGIRNKIHIQNSSYDEDRVFTDTNLKLSEDVLEFIIKYMVEKYPRSKTSGIKLVGFPFPWK